MTETYAIDGLMQAMTSAAKQDIRVDEVLVSMQAYMAIDARLRERVSIEAPEEHEGGIVVTGPHGAVTIAADTSLQREAGVLFERCRKPHIGIGAVCSTCHGLGWRIVGTVRFVGVPEGEGEGA